MLKFILSLKRNMVFVLKIETIALFMYTYVIFPICQMVLNKVMISQGYGYFFDKGIRGAAKNPWILLTAFAIIMFIGICFYFEIMILINAIINSNQTLKSIIKKSLYSIKKLFSPFGILFIFISSFISMLIHFNLINRIIQGLGLVENIKFYFTNYPKLAYPIGLLIIAIVYLFIRFIFIYPILACDNISVKKSFSLSAKLVKKNIVNTSVKLLVLNVITIVFFAIVYIIVIFGVVLIIKNTEIIMIQYAASMTVIDTINRLLIFFFSIALTIINMEASVLLCRKYDIEGTGFYCELTKELPEKRAGKKNSRVWTLLLLFALASFILINVDYLHNFRLKTGYNPEGRKPMIIAHRGSSNSAPENTLAALSVAIDEIVDGVEIDVRMTKDGEIVLMHDSTLQRTAGINAHVSELTYSEIADIDVGSWFSPSYQEEKIPTLMEALELCKGEMILMIEVKGGQYDEYDIAQKIVSDVEEMGMSQDVIVASFNKDVLKEVKELNGSIVTCLILRFAYGNINEMEYVDMFSMESYFVYKGIFKNIKNSGKSLAVWTVNDRRQMASLRDVGIDQVVTDHPVRAREVFYEDAVPGFLDNIIASMLEK